MRFHSERQSKRGESPGPGFGGLLRLALSAVGIGNDPNDGADGTFNWMQIEEVPGAGFVATGGPRHGRVTAAPGDNLLVNLRSPGGAHDWEVVPLIVGQFITAGAEPSALFAYPELRLDLASPSVPFFVHDGFTASPFGGVGALPPGGVNLAAAVPAGLTNVTLVLQGVGLGNTSTVNNIFAASNAVMIDL